MPLRQRLIVLSVLAAAVVGVFGGVLRHDWIIVDDGLYVYENPVISRGLTLPGIVHFLGHDHGVNWVPVTALSHMLDVQLYGLRPAGHHATNLLIHVASTLLVVLLLRKLTGAWWRSVIVAALFALHPLRVESVAWIAERKDVLSTFFFLLSCFAWAHWAERPGLRRYAAVFAAVLLALWSKPMAITLPFVLVLLDIWPLGRLANGPAAWRRAGGAAPRPLWGLFMEKWALFALVGVVTVVTYRFQAAAGAVTSDGFFTLGRRIANGLLNYWRYPLQMAWPVRLAPFHAHDGSINTGGAIAAAAALVIVTALALRAAPRRPWLAFGWLWYVGTLVPAVGFVQTGGHAYADRFTYLPCLGLLVALVWSGHELAEPRGRGARRAAIAVAAVAVVALSALSVRQLQFWRNTQTYAERVMAISGGNPLADRVAHRWIGLWLYEKGRLAEAVPHMEIGAGLAPGTEQGLRRALEQRPDGVETRRQLAAMLTRVNRVEEGVSLYREILAANPGDLDALVNIAWVRSTHEQAKHRDGAEAVALARRALELCPDAPAVIYSTLAAALAETAQFPAAVEAGQKAVALARAAGQAEEAAEYARQLGLYRAKRAFHHDA
jgi:hypothetical protein